MNSPSHAGQHDGANDAIEAIETHLGTSSSPNFLPVAGGSMSGAIAMGANKITGLANGSSPQDAATFGQLGDLPSWFQSGVGDPITENPTTPNVSGALYFDTSGESGLWISPTGTDGDWVNFGAINGGIQIGGGSDAINIVPGLAVIVQSSAEVVLQPTTDIAFTIGDLTIAWFLNDGNPNGVVVAVDIGDFCIDVSSPGLWQSTAADDSHWVQFATDTYVTTAVATETSRAETAEALLAPLASPALTGTPTVPTATAGTNTTQAASTAFVLANAGGSGPKYQPFTYDGVR